MPILKRRVLDALRLSEWQNLATVLPLSGYWILDNSFVCWAPPLVVIIQSLMENATPHALAPDMLHQRRGVVEDGPFQSCGQARHFDVLFALYFSPMLQKEPGCGQAHQVCLTAKNRVGIHHHGIASHIAS